MLRSPAMRLGGSLVVLRLGLPLGLLLGTAAAHAEEGPRIVIGADLTVGHGGRVEALDFGWRAEPGVFVRVGRWHATVSLPIHPLVTSHDRDRDGVELFGLGLGARLAYRLPVGGAGVLTVGAGLTRRWLDGYRTVVRGCRDTGACVAGFYPEKPAYHAWAPQLRIGVGPEKRDPSVVGSVAFELIVEAIGLHDVPPAGVRGIAVGGALTFTLGGGPRRRQNL